MADDGFREMYEKARPEPRLVEEIARRLPRASVAVVSAYWCADSRRDVPRWARMAEALPGWEHTLYDYDAETTKALDIRAIPTFIVSDADTGQEIGRIVERPTFGRLEVDLLAMLGERDDG